jgi:hypothetical protein
MTMATRAQLQSMMRAQPFRQFSVKLSSGRSFTVKHPDYVSYSPNGDEMTVHDDEGPHLVDMLLVEVLEPVNSPVPPKSEGNGA